MLKLKNYKINKFMSQPLKQIKEVMVDHNLKEVTFVFSVEVIILHLFKIWIISIRNKSNKMRIQKSILNPLTLMLGN